MRKLILTFVLGTLCLGAFSQEAFYIYRNDGDFNGFFYDEVVEMRQSKIGVDSVEYDRWVTQEVVLADTIYRIPLAAIDSIGFQQPEIKLNPKVKFIERDGYAPYIIRVTDYSYAGYEHGVSFQNLPANKLPDIGDVLIGLPSDVCADSAYVYAGGSFSMVIEGVRSYEDGIVFMYGNPVTELNQVFEQYITVEQIGIDDQNQIHRRIAGCTPDGLPYKMPQKQGGGEAKLVNLDGSFSRSWQIPKDCTQVDLTVDMNLQVKFRVAYDIRWTKFYVKMTEDFALRVRPTIGLTVKREFEASTDDLVKEFPKVLFPAACPIFETKPFPALFLKASGSLEARLKLPQVYMGLGSDIIINCPSLLPIWQTFHLVPDENTEPTEDMLDFSASVKLNGTIYTGIEFQAVVNTASWFRKIFQCGIGLHFYFGPKATAELEWNHSFTNDEQLYSQLFGSKLGIAFISLGMDATAKSKIGWGDEHEDTFFSGSKDFLEYNFRLAPQFGDMDVEKAADYTILTANVNPKDMVLLYRDFSIGVWDAAGDYDSVPPVMESKIFSPATTDDKGMYYLSVRHRDLKAKEYIAMPILRALDGTINILGSRAYFKVPGVLSLDKNQISFDGSGTQTHIVKFTTNADPDDMFFWSVFVQKELDTLDAKKGEYQLRCCAIPNRALFADVNLPATGEDPEHTTSLSTRDTTCYIGIHIDKSDLSNVGVGVSISGDFDIGGGLIDNGGASFYGKVTATRGGDGSIRLTGSKRETNGDYTDDYTISMDVYKTDFDSVRWDYNFNVYGTVTYKSTNKNVGEMQYCSFTFSNAESENPCSLFGGGGVFKIKASEITSKTYRRKVWESDGMGNGQYVTRHGTYVAPSGSTVVSDWNTIQVHAPGDE